MGLKKMLLRGRKASTKLRQTNTFKTQFIIYFFNYLVGFFLTRPDICKNPNLIVSTQITLDQDQVL